MKIKLTDNIWVDTPLAIAEILLKNVIFLPEMYVYFKGYRDRSMYNKLIFSTIKICMNGENVRL